MRTSFKDMFFGPNESFPQGLPETELLAAIVRSSDDAIIAKTLEGIVISWNAGAERIYGYTTAEAIGLPISTLFPKDRLDENERILERVRRGQAIDHYETERLTKAGKRIWVSLSVSPIRDANGQVIGSSAIARDITSLRKAEVALIESERRYRLLVETAVHGICRTTTEGRFLDVNPALVHILGYADREQLLGLDPADLYVDPSVLGQMIALCLQGGRPRQDVQWRRKDGTRITVHLSAQAVFDGTQTTLEAVAEDVTVQRELEQRLQRLQRIELLGQLAGEIAHDFNNYLNVITGHEAMLSIAIGSNEKLCRHVCEIRKAVDRAAELTSRLLLLGRKDDQAPEESDLNVIVNETQGMLQGVLRHNLQLALELAAKPMKVRVCPGEIQQMLLNLVVNGRDAMSKGGCIIIRTRSISISTPVTTTLGDTLCGDYIILAVADTGHGMDDTTRTHAVEAFFSTKPSGKGTGLGLSSVYAAVKRYGGGLQIETAEDKGTNVSLYFPACVGHCKTQSELEVETQASPKTILVVDDEPALNRMVSEALAEADFRLAHAANWKDAAAILQQQKVDLLVCDLGLPDISPRELLEQLRWLHQTVKIVVISGDMLTEDDERRLRPGIFLRKPFAMPELLRIIRAQADRDLRDDAASIR